MTRCNLTIANATACLPAFGNIRLQQSDRLMTFFRIKKKKTRVHIAITHRAYTVPAGIHPASCPGAARTRQAAKDNPVISISAPTKDNDS